MAMPDEMNVLLLYSTQRGDMNVLIYMERYWIVGGLII